MCATASAEMLVKVTLRRIYIDDVVLLCYLFYFIYEYLLAVVLLPLAQHYNTALDNAKKMLREYNN